MAQKGMDDYKLVLGAGEERSLNVKGDFFHVIDADGEIGLTFDEGKRITRTETMGGRVYYERVSVYSPIAQTITLALGFGYATDARATVNATVNTTIEPANLNTQLPEVTVPNGGSIKLADANPDRKELRVSIKSTETGGVYIGDPTIANNEGGWLEAGQVDYVPTEAEVWAYNPGGVDVVVSILDLERA